MRSKYARGVQEKTALKPRMERPSGEGVARSLSRVFLGTHTFLLLLVFVLRERLLAREDRREHALERVGVAVPGHVALARDDEDVRRVLHFKPLLQGPERRAVGVARHLEGDGVAPAALVVEEAVHDVRRLARDGEVVDAVVAEDLVAAVEAAEALPARRARRGEADEHRRGALGVGHGGAALNHNQALQLFELGAHLHLVLRRHANASDALLLLVATLGVLEVDIARHANDEEPVPGAELF
mmetsp:Transcript_23672/g.74484  ORF Transcript_23672/g.74484 Transcript_23672/m.74484 type:complete len:242 (+) Transcript_23672:1982-2707(+)